MTKEFNIYTRWLAVALREQGYKILRTEVNKYHPQFDVYVFEDSQELQEAMLALTRAH